MNISKLVLQSKLSPRRREAITTTLAWATLNWRRDLSDLAEKSLSTCVGDWCRNCGRRRYFRLYSESTHSSQYSHCKYSAVSYCLLLLSRHKHLNFFQTLYFPQEPNTGVPAAPAAPLSGTIGSDVNANAAVVVPPTPIQGNQQNGNGVAPSVENDLLVTMLMEQQRTNNRHDDEFQEMQRTTKAQMMEQRRINDRNDDRFEAMQRTNNAQMDILAGMRIGMSDLGNKVSGLQADQATLKTGHATLESNYSELKAAQDDNKEKIDYIIKSIKKKRYSFGDTPDSKGGTSGKSTLSITQYAKSIFGCISLQSFLLICLVVSDDDGVKDTFIPKVLDFSEGGCYHLFHKGSHLLESFRLTVVLLSFICSKEPHRPKKSPKIRLKNWSVLFLTLSASMNVSVSFANNFNRLPLHSMTRWNILFQRCFVYLVVLSFLYNSGLSWWHFCPPQQVCLGKPSRNFS